jgi:segregation and condensation protein A
MITYRIDLPAFSGPLDLLLHLIDRHELDITAISLAQVTQQYLEQIEEMKMDRIDNLIDFLVVGARLVLIKSRALLPQEIVIPIEGQEEEDPAEALLRQLRTYRRFKQVAAALAEREAAGLRTYLRVAPPPKLEPRLDLAGLTIQHLAHAFLEALSRSERKEDSVAIVQPRRITIEDQLRKLRARIQNAGHMMFDELLSRRTDVVELSVTLLAVLESIKRREVNARQETPFGPIQLLRAAPLIDDEDDRPPDEEP